MAMPPAVFLDRDGTMIHDAGYLSRREDLRWYAFGLDAIRLLTRAGLLVFVTTNQGGVGLGFYDEAFVRDTHAALDAQVRASGGRVDGWFYCPHHPRARHAALRVECDCRKPGTGMIRMATDRFAIDLAQSFVVGDKHADVEMARRAGATGILVKTGHGAGELARWTGDAPPHVADHLAAATAWILERRRGQEVR